MYTYQTDSDEEVQEAELKHFEHHVEHTEISPRHLVYIKVPMEYLVLKKTTRRAYERKCNWNKSGECTIPVSCRRHSFSQSPGSRPR